MREFIKRHRCTVLALVIALVISIAAVPVLYVILSHLVGDMIVRKAERERVLPVQPQKN